MDPTRKNEDRSPERYSIPRDQLPARFRLLNCWSDLLNAIRALHVLAAARFPMADGLLQMSQEAPNRVLQHVFYWLHRELQGGVPLHVAMGNRPEFFPPFCVDLVRAGEESGQLEAVLDDLQQEIEAGFEFRRALMWQFVFSFWTLITTVLYLAVVMLFVTPQLSELLQSSGQDSPPLLSWVIALSQSGLPVALVILAIGVPALWLATEFSFIRGGILAREVDLLTAWIPGLGGFKRKRHLAGAAAISGRLLHAGAPLPTALRRAADAGTAALCAKSLRKLADRVEAGETLSTGMASERWGLPASFQTMVALGEASGRLPETLVQIATLYRTQTRHTARLALELGIPMLICIVGFLVFLVYGSVFAVLAEMQTVLR